MTSKQYLLIPLSLIILALIGWFAFIKLTPPSHNNITLTFKATVAGEALDFNKPLYPNPAGEGKFQIRDFQFYISNIKLIARDHLYSDPYVYHLARFDNDKKSFRIALEQVPHKEYQAIELSIGIDKIANSTILSQGDLDPNNRMAWSWDVGHKFILFEGSLATGQGLKPLVYHVGFNENYKTLTFPITNNKLKQSDNHLQFSVDIMTLFNGENPINMDALSSVKFDPEDAKILANNYQNMIQATW